MACAECGCVVDHGIRVVSCGDDGCCCRHLPVADDGDGDDRPGVLSHADERPSWTTPRQALSVIAHRPHLGATVRIALTVGTVLFVINQLDVVIRGDATAVTWLKSVVTYLVPFVVSNLGILTATRVPQEDATVRGRRSRRKT